MYNEKYIITLAKFLSRYEFIKGRDLKKITHEEVKELFPEIKRTTFEDVERHKELLCTGKYILVNDGKKIIPYIVPELNYKENDYQELNREKTTGIIVDDNNYDYSKLSEYELRQLLRRKFSSKRNQYLARKELIQRGIEITKKYKRVKKLIKE